MNSTFIAGRTTLTIIYELDISMAQVLNIKPSIVFKSIISDCNKSSKLMKPKQHSVVGISLIEMFTDEKSTIDVHYPLQLEQEKGIKFTIYIPIKK